jgi:hypothetical protein
MLPSYVIKGVEWPDGEVWQASGICLSVSSVVVYRCLSTLFYSSDCTLPWPALHSLHTPRRLSHQPVTAPPARASLSTRYLPTHSVCGTAEPSCGVKKSNSSGLSFRTAAKPPAPVNSFCRSQSVLGPHWASSARALCPLHPHQHQHHHLPRRHHHLPPSLSPFHAHPVAIARPLRKPASGPTSIRYNLHPRPIRASVKSPTPTLTQPKATHRNHHMYSRCL